MTFLGDELGCSAERIALDLLEKEPAFESEFLVCVLTISFFEHSHSRSERSMCSMHS